MRAVPINLWWASLRYRLRAVRVVERGSLAFVLFCGTAFVAKSVGLQIVYTPSVPVGVYLRHDLDAGHPPAHGEYVCLEGWRATAPALFRATVQAGVVPADWGRNEALVKRVAASSGDRVTYVASTRAAHVEVNGVPLANSEALAQDGLGATLPKPPYPFVLGPDEVWLTSEHPRGFDSRYFGPVKVSALGCRTRLLWAW